MHSKQYGLVLVTMFTDLGNGREANVTCSKMHNCDRTGYRLQWCFDLVFNAFSNPPHVCFYSLKHWDAAVFCLILYEAI